MIDAENKQTLPLDLSVIVTQRNAKPCIELRKVTTDIEWMKTIISCALHDRPIIVMPKFRDTLSSINTLQEKGLIYREGNQYFFTL